MRILPKSWLPLAIATPLGLMAAGLAWVVRLLPEWYEGLLATHPAYGPVFAAEGVGVTIELFYWAALGGTALLLTAFLVGLTVHRGWSLGVVRKGCLLVGVLLAVEMLAVLKATGALASGNIPIGSLKPDSWNVFFCRLHYLGPALLALAVAMAVQVLTWCGATMAVYTGERPSQPAPGDRLIEALRWHRLAPSYRKSLYKSVSLHLFVILILPWLLSLRGCVDPYRIPKGEGEPVIERVVKVVRKKKPQKRYVVNPNSAIIFHLPDDMKLMREVDKESQVEYAADPTRVHKGKLGVGKKGKGGWPDGMDDAVVRFIRLEHGGPHWDDGMDAKSRADINFLQEFKRVTGFKVAPRGESHPVRVLKNYPKGFAPPFVYLTGSGDIRISARDIEILRAYLLDGGMLFADAGSQWFDRNFRSLAQSLFPGNPLREIADDDPLFQQPYVFPNGAPPLWHHGGWRSMGIKHKDRWVVFYHPGDMNDTWKNDRSGMSMELAQSAMDLGINIIHYSFTHYLEMTRKHRK